MLTIYQVNFYEHNYEKNIIWNVHIIYVQIKKW